MADKEVKEPEAELPKAQIKRIVKSKLAHLQTGDKEVQINKDALLAFSESSKIFISYLTATANDICKENKRQIVSAEDVLQALDDMEFPEFVEPLRTFLAEYQQAAKDKNKKKAENQKKRKEKQDDTGDVDQDKVEADPEEGEEQEPKRAKGEEQDEEQ